VESSSIAAHNVANTSCDAQRAGAEFAGRFGAFVRPAQQVDRPCTRRSAAEGIEIVGTPPAKYPFPAPFIALFPFVFLLRTRMITLNVNGRPLSVDAEPDTPLLWALRDILHLTGTKYGCGIGLCGACTVHIDGRAVRSCVTPISAVGTAAITTIESMASDRIGKALQDAWIELDVPQCGYCQPGQIMQARALLIEKPRPSDEDIDAAMADIVCRCGTYPRIRDAIRKVALALSPAEVK
jgi:isoquinoline 1-oxidoreductase alpha subunit